MTTYKITIDLDKKCKRCGKGGATPGGICMGCVAKAVKNGECDHILKKYKPQIRKAE